MDLRSKLDSALAPGCHILRELGGGGMSRVFLAEDAEHGREIVVKVIPSELTGQVNVERFRREIKVAARLQHPCIVPVLSSGSADGLPYYTMPFVDGESLRSRLARERGLSVQESVRILRDIASAVSYAHEHGIVHRDIKPDNIIVTKHHAVLVDFGVAKALTEATLAGGPLTSVGIALGTPAYMAPEQAAADPSVDHRADIYSLGVVAYEMLAGRHPFEGRSSQSMLAAHAIENPNSVTVHRPQLPPAIGSLVMRMLEKHPGDRPQSADEVLAALDQIQTPTATVASTLAPRTSTTLRKRRLIIGSAAAGGVLTLVGLSLFAFRGNLRPTPSLATENVLVMSPSGSDASLAGEASDRIRNALLIGLAQVRTANVVDRPDQNNAPHLSPADAGRREGAGTVLTTNLYSAGDSIELQFKLVDATTDRVVRALPSSKVSRGLADAELRNAIDPVLTAVGFATEPALGAVAIPSTIPNFAAFESYATAIQMTSKFDTASVRYTSELFRKAFQQDTSFIQARLALAWWLRSVGNYFAGSWFEETELLKSYTTERRSKLTPYEQVFADFTTEYIANDRQVAALRKLIAFNPHAPFRSALPNILLNLNRPYGADSAFNDLLKADSSAAKFPNFWIGRAALYHYTGEYKKSLDAATRARKLAPSDITSFRPALTALAALGDTVEFLKMLDAAAVASPSGTFFGFAGDLYLEAGQELVAHGNPDLGRRILERAAAWFDGRSPEQINSPTMSLRAALAYINVNKLDRAERMLQSAADPDVRFVGLVGRIAALRGDTATAESIATRLAALPAEKRFGTPTFERAQIAAELGRREMAVTLLRESFTQGIPFSYRSRIHWFANFYRMGDYAPFKALITPQG